MLAFIHFIRTLLFLSTACAAATVSNNHNIQNNQNNQNKPDPTVQQCGRSWGDFAKLGPDRKGCLTYGSVHYDCGKNDCGIGEAPAPGVKSSIPIPLFSNCRKYLDKFGDDSKLDSKNITALAMSYFFDYKNKWVRVIGYDSLLKGPPAGDLPGYTCLIPADPPKVIEVCRNCTLLHNATW
ncbi:uncharacterized protein MELLADRAFT_110947 [Melampsora larici-populina 98AG31]|uniref:Secreted protein n=1 Tax=Melampsora larici-populina (strain 98AG31 / pathotype 3-4-7) TaxID=747676 RepID=F4S1I8_MELLP|nr:uncharacterized protein MELLADRAFT_110947 [Melampsora larici-populina 98AG31]EGG01383.1 secreted protein [Melampsora larici-populina 98AG31]